MKMIATAYLFLVLAFPVWAEDKTSRDTKYVKAEIYYYGWDILTRNRLSLEFIRQYPKIKTSIIGPFETNSLVEWLISDGMSVASRDRLHSFNRYAYGNNNPYRFVDPDGRASLAIDAGVLLLVGGTVYVTSSPEQRALMNRAAERVWEGIQSNMQPWNDWNRTVSWGPNNNQASEGDPGTSLNNNPMLSKGLPPGFWPGDKGGEEWGRRNGVGAKEGRGRFHGIKQDDKGRGKISMV